MRKAVIFDMDGVLSDSEFIYVEKIMELMREEGLDVPVSEISDLFGKSMIYICQELIRRYRLPGNASGYARMIHARRDDYIRKNGLFPMEGAPELVKSLYQRRIPLAVASSAPLETIRGNMERFGIADYIGHLVSGLDLKAGKPDPEIYLTAASLLGISPADCLVIEDSANGVAAAKNAGMYCIAYVPSKAVPQDLSRADRMLTSFVGVTPEMIL